MPFTRDMQRLFPGEGPSNDEETARCQPPEALDRGVTQASPSFAERERERGSADGVPNKARLVPRHTQQRV